MNRPQNLKSYVGQSRIKALIDAELKGGAFPRHILLYGLPGLGKTSLAGVVAHEAGIRFINWKASREMTPRKLTGDLFQLSVNGYDAGGQPVGPACDKYLVFIDEIHDLPSFEVLYTALEDRTLNPDPHGKVSWLPLICFVVATTNPNALPKPFRDRFPLKFRLDPYTAGDLVDMIGSHFGSSVPKKTAREIATRSRGNARDCINYTESVLRHGLEYFDLMEIDAAGLTALDRAVLDALRSAGRPLSLNTLAAMVREDPATVRDVVEPALLTAGLMEITSRGRQAVGLNYGGSRGAVITEAFAR